MLNLRSLMGLGCIGVIGVAGAACTAFDDVSPNRDGGATAAKSNAGSGGGSVVSATTGASGTSVGAGGEALGDMNQGGGGSADTSDAGAMDEMPVIETPPSICYPVVPTGSMIADFHDIGQTTGISWGDFSGGFSGYSFQYGAGLTSDVTTGVWHLTGMVSEASGFGLGFNFDNSHNVDASSYSGLQFTIKGNAGASGTLTLAVQNSPDFGPSPTSCAKCMSGCADPKKTFNVSPGATTVSLKWSDFQEGLPNAGVDPKQVLGLIWFFVWNGQGSQPYAIDVTVDDVMFIAGGRDAAAE